jgi:hypothetical protein
VIDNKKPTEMSAFCCGASSSKDRSLRQLLQEYRVSPPVGAGLLAIVVNDDAGCLDPLGVLETIASKPAPTGFALFAFFRGAVKSFSPKKKLRSRSPVGAGLLAMNDYADHRRDRNKSMRIDLRNHD